MAAAQPLHRWLFVDMDSFFASVEQHLRPELRGRMVGIIPVESQGTCIIAASRDAKALGIKVGTPVREARALNPDIILVKARPRIYVSIHHAILRSVDRCAPVYKVYSIDEWSIRLIGKERTAANAISLAHRIKQQLLTDFSPHLACSIGIAPTRLLAKIGSDIEKPNGLVVLDPAALPARLDHLKLTDLPGIASGMLERLHAAGIRSVRELWNISAQDSRRIWNSSSGEDWWHGFHGNDIPEQATTRSTITHASVLAPEFRTDTGARGILIRLICKGAARLRQHQHASHRLGISVRSYSGKNWNVDAPLEGTQSTLAIVRAFESLWLTRPWSAHPKSWEPIAQVSMTLSRLTPLESTTPSLFAEDARLQSISNAMDRINKRWGNHSVYLGSMHNFRHEMEDKIAFGRIPDDDPANPYDRSP